MVEGNAPERGEKWRNDKVSTWQYFADLVAPEYGDMLLGAALFRDGLREEEDWPPRRRRQPAVTPSLPEVRQGRLASRSPQALTHQLNVRLRADQQRRLVEVAKQYGMTPAGLARLFILRGLEATR